MSFSRQGQREAVQRMTQRMLQGWKLSEDMCPIESCGNKLLKSESGAIYCASCDVGLDSSSNGPNVSSSPISSAVPSKVEYSPSKLKSVDRDKVSSIIGQRLLQGYRMLGEHCQKCHCLLLGIPRSSETECVQCNVFGSPTAASVPSPVRQVPPSTASSTGHQTNSLNHLRNISDSFSDDELVELSESSNSRIKSTNSDDSCWSSALKDVEAGITADIQGGPKARKLNSEAIVPFDNNTALNREVASKSKLGEYLSSGVDPNTVVKRVRVSAASVDLRSRVDEEDEVDSRGTHKQTDSLSALNSAREPPYFSPSSNTGAEYGITDVVRTYDDHAVFKSKIVKKETESAKATFKRVSTGGTGLVYGVSVRDAPRDWASLSEEQIQQMAGVSSKSSSAVENTKALVSKKVMDEARFLSPSGSVEVISSNNSAWGLNTDDNDQELIARIEAGLRKAQEEDLKCLNSQTTAPISVSPLPATPMVKSTPIVESGSLLSVENSVSATLELLEKHLFEENKNIASLLTGGKGISSYNYAALSSHVLEAVAAASERVSKLSKAIKSLQEL